MQNLQDGSTLDQTQINQNTSYEEEQISELNDSSGSLEDKLSNQRSDVQEIDSKLMNSLMEHLIIKTVEMMLQHQQKLQLNGNDTYPYGWRTTKTFQNKEMISFRIGDKLQYGSYASDKSILEKTLIAQINLEKNTFQKEIDYKVNEKGLPSIQWKTDEKSFLENTKEKINAGIGKVVAPVTHSINFGKNLGSKLWNNDRVKGLRDKFYPLIKGGQYVSQPVNGVTNFMGLFSELLILMKYSNNITGGFSYYDIFNALDGIKELQDCKFDLGKFLDTQEQDPEQPLKERIKRQFAVTWESKHIKVNELQDKIIKNIDAEKFLGVKYFCVFYHKILTNNLLDEKSTEEEKREFIRQGIEEYVELISERADRKTMHNRADEIDGILNDMVARSVEYIVKPLHQRLELEIKKIDQQISFEQEEESKSDNSNKKDRKEGWFSYMQTKMFGASTQKKMD